jgi:hypothetical protein
VVFSLLISPYEVYLFEVIGVSEGRVRNPIYCFGDKLPKCLFAFSAS